MKEKILIISIFAAALIILVSIAPAVGSNIANFEIKENYSSPLFSVRSQQSKEIKNIDKIDATYIGEGITNNYFPIKKSTIQSLADKTIKVINENPKIIPIILEKLVKIPEISKVLGENSININEFKNQISYILNNPQVLKEKLIDPQSPDNNIPPQPLGLSTSSPIGCFIIVLVMAPLLVVLGAIIATITIVTCLVPTCFESFMENMLDNFIQGLKPPELD